VAKLQVFYFKAVEHAVGFVEEEIPRRRWSSTACTGPGAEEFGARPQSTASSYPLGQVSTSTPIKGIARWGSSSSGDARLLLRRRRPAKEISSCFWLQRIQGLVCNFSFLQGPL
jgi:hypothetical protein